ncbi:MAG: carbohydrate binding domain-containing protein [Dictyoglomaceae bacterium]
MKKFLVVTLLLIFIVLISGCAKPQEVSQVPVPTTPEVEGKVSEVPKAVVLTTFESGDIEGWQPRGSGVKITVTDKEAHAGKFSLYIEGRSADWHGAQIPLKNILKPGKTYSISIWVFQNSGSDQNMGLTMQRKYNTDGSTQYNWIKHGVVPSGKWVEFAGTYSIPADVSVEELTLYVEVPGNVTLSFYIDDLVITEGKTGFKITPELYDLFAKYYKDYLD